MNAWKSIFLQSPVNSGHYDEDELPHQIWDWPKATWFQGRLDRVREHEPLDVRSPRRRARKVGNPLSVSSIASTI
jgi:hypothetical protein